MDLSLSFGPAWAREEDTKERREALAKRHGGGEERPRKGGKRDDLGGPRARPNFKRTERTGGRDDKRGGGRRDDRGRDDRRPPEPKEEPKLSGWTVKFLPDRRGVEGLAKQIKASAKAFPLFDLARLVLEKSERYVVEFRRAGEDSQPIWQVKADGTLWTSEGEAVARALGADLEKYYRRERVTVDPPKGSFPFVAVCGMSGTLLGPPNYHDYQVKVMALYQERFANLPFEVYKSRIKMERDEELIEKWRSEQSATDVFYEILPEEPVPTVEETLPTVGESVPTAEESLPTVEESIRTAEESVPTVEESVPTVEESLPTVEESIPTAEESVPTVEESVPTVEELAPTVEEPEPRVSTGQRFETMADVEAHFRANHLKQAVIAIRDRVLVSGSAALNDSAPLVLGLTRGVWGELDRFPLPIAHGLGQQLGSKGLQIFKLNDKVTYVGVARPRPLDLAVTPMSEGLSGIYNYVAEHPGQSRVEQRAGLIALRPEDQADRESAVARDLSWLIHEGYVVDFAKKGLAVLPRSPGRKPEVAKPKEEQIGVLKEPVVAADSSVEPLAEVAVESVPEPEAAVVDEPEIVADAEVTPTEETPGA